MPEFDITLLTQRKYLSAEPQKGFIDDFTADLLKEDRLLTTALEKRGLKVTRTNWDNPDFDWGDTGHVIVRTPWDYFSRYDEFLPWFENTNKITKFINSYETIVWNIDKHYMLDLEKAGINMPATVFVEPGDKRSLAVIAADTGWDEFILKPAVSGGAWHTYLVDQNNIQDHEEIFRELTKDKCMLLQEYQRSISDKGEVSFIVLGGKFTHAILKKSKPGDFRVQANHGGTIEDYSPSEEEVNFAEDIIKKSNVEIAYARVDVLWDNNDELCLCELELFEPELWFRKNPPAAEVFADTILRTIN